VQKEGIMACVQHYALNLMENAHSQVNVKAEDNALHEVCFAHSRRIVEGG
jgi:beta-glucosidase-like glycosyl hydrolase